MRSSTDLPSPNTVPPARCLDWLAYGWRQFLRDPARWALIGALFVLILGALGVVPLIGWAVTLLAFPVLGAGLVAAADHQANGRTLQLEALFDGLRTDAGKHVMVGVFHLVAALMIGFMAFLIGASAALTGAILGPLAAVGLTAGGVMLAVVVFMALWIMVIMALWFAPALIRFHGADPIDALTHSIDACLRNLPVCLVLALAIYVLAWVAMVPAGLGLLVLVPVLAGAHHAAYLDIFADRPALPEHIAPPR
jgi:uncharacterized membrane protein